ncbi:hypothetical protein HDU92_002239 [Lobulomyces angularis]|nr:hypothetical protein HDU92_002239 [Lobulomyces angularis]
MSTIFIICIVVLIFIIALLSYKIYKAYQKLKKKPSDSDLELNPQKIDNKLKDIQNDQQLYQNEIIKDHKKAKNNYINIYRVELSPPQRVWSPKFYQKLKAIIPKNKNVPKPTQIKVDDGNFELSTTTSTSTASTDSNTLDDSSQYSISELNCSEFCNNETMKADLIQESENETKKKSTQILNINPSPQDPIKNDFIHYKIDKNFFELLKSDTVIDTKDSEFPDSEQVIQEGELNIWNSESCNNISPPPTTTALEGSDSDSFSRETEFYNTSTNNSLNSLQAEFLQIPIPTNSDALSFGDNFDALNTKTFKDFNISPLSPNYNKSLVEHKRNKVYTKPRETLGVAVLIRNAALLMIKQEKLLQEAEKNEVNFYSFEEESNDVGYYSSDSDDEIDDSSEEEY